MSRIFYASSGSVLGRAHARFHKNNQDGHGVQVMPTCAIAVVTDGCSSQPHSEVGANLGSQFLLQFISQQEDPFQRNLPKRTMLALLQYLGTISCLGTSVPSQNFVEKNFLFTFLVAICDGDRAFIFGRGDGSFVIDSTCTTIDPGPDNAPNYAAYCLGDKSPNCVTHFLGPANCCAVMTDGLDPQVALEWLNPSQVTRNSFFLQRQLNVRARTNEFQDDATLAFVGAAQ